MAQLPGFQIRIIGPEGERIERLQKPVLVLGRSPECDLIVADTEVSRRHLEIKVSAQGVQIVDLGSKNGTFLDGRRLVHRQSYPWRLGQVLRLGLATEQLELMQAGGVSVSGDAPPPVDSVSRKIPVRREVAAPKIAAPKLNIDLNAKVPSPHPEGEPREDSIWLGLRNEVKKQEGTEPTEKGDVNEESESLDFGGTDSKISLSPSPTLPKEESPGPSLMKDLESRMSELMKKVELDAKNIMVPDDSIPPKASGDDELNLERARIDNQVRDLKAEVVARHDERKAVARELADAKLRLQQLREEKERYEAACKQLPAQIRGEIAELEDRHFQLQEKVAQADDAATKAANREAKDLVEKAKKQVELILAEGEIKAKAQREKLQVELADERRAAELDLADLKLKQIAGIKSDQDQLDRDLGKRQEKLNEGFMNALLVRMDGMAAKGDLTPEAKLVLATEIERLTVQYWGGGSKGNVKPFPLPQENQAAAASQRRFTLRSVAISGIAMVLFAVVTWQITRSRTQSTQMASKVALPPPITAAAPTPAPQAPVAQAPVMPAPIVPAPAPAVSPSAESVVDQIQATTAVERRVAPEPVARPSWNQVLNGSYGHKWSIQSAAYLRSMRLDRAKISRYQALEQKLSKSLSPRGRTLASERDRRRLEAQFARDASRLLGQKNWAKMLSFRNRFVEKNR